MPPNPDAPANTTPDATKKERKPRVPKAGKLITFRVTDAEYAALQAAGQADYRTAENVAYVATMKAVAALNSAAK